MQLLQRYFFRQMLGPALWSLAALTGIGVLSQSLAALRLVIDQRQSGWMFAKITLLSLPQTMTVIAPLSLLVAALITLNRLQTEQEVVVSYAGGVSRWKVASPALRLAAWATLITLAVNLFVQPWATREMNAEINAARADLAASLVREGQFTQPAAGLTIYAQDVARGGAMTNLFVHQVDPKNPNHNFVYTAREGALVKRNGGYILIMKRGATQELSNKSVLNYLSFDQYPFDLQPILGSTRPVRQRAIDRYMTELFQPAAGDTWAREHRGELLAEAHSRIANPLYNLVMMAFAIAAVLGGGFNRLGYGKRIALWAAGAVFLRILGYVVQSACEDAPNLNALQYALPVTAFIGAMAPFLLGGVRRPKRRLAAVLAAGAA